MMTENTRAESVLSRYHCEIADAGEVRAHKRDKRQAQ